jgi:hypothetical protein
MKRYNPMPEDPYVVVEMFEDKDGEFLYFNDANKEIERLNDRVKELVEGIRESMRYLEFEVPTGAYKCLEALLPKEKQ